MNDTIPGPAILPERLHLSIAPWLGDAPLLGDSRDVSRLVDEGRLKLSIAPGESAKARLWGLRTLLDAAAKAMGGDPALHVDLDHSGIAITAAALEPMLADWSDDAIPVQALFSFDFAVDGARGVAGCATKGLSAIIGQELVCWPQDAALRCAAARLILKVAQSLLLAGPVRTVRFVAAPEAPGGRVALVPRTAPMPHVEIVF